MLKRERYLSKIRKSYDVDIIKVITGVRRCGKSVLLSQIKDELMDSGVKPDHFIDINFENVEFEKINTYKKLDSYVKKRIKDKEKYYIFLDEIQHVRSFEKALASLKASTYSSIFVTGSSSKLLSGRLGSLLVGRCIEFEIKPFSFKEAYDFLSMNGSAVNADRLIYDYLRWGGLPLRFSYSDSENIRKYIFQTYEGILKKDICTNKSKINFTVFSLISSYVQANSGNEFSALNISRYFSLNNNEKIDKTVIYRYLDKMEKAYLISREKKFNITGKKQLKYFEKQYSVDPGFITINSNFINIPLGYVLETVIYNELVCRGYVVMAGKTNKGEVDFIVSNGLGKKCYIQVSYLLASEETINREFGAYDTIKDNSPKYVFSLDRYDFSQNGITNMNIVDFLLGISDIVLS